MFGIFSFFWFLSGEKDPNSVLDSFACIFPPFERQELTYSYLFYIDPENDAKSETIPATISWYQARDFCRDVVGTDLASFHSLYDFEQGALADFQAHTQLTNVTWFGGQHVSGAWAYSDASP